MACRGAQQGNRDLTRRPTTNTTIATNTSTKAARCDGRELPTKSGDCTRGSDSNGASRGPPSARVSDASDEQPRPTAWLHMQRRQAEAAYVDGDGFIGGGDGGDGFGGRQGRTHHLPADATTTRSDDADGAAIYGFRERFLRRGGRGQRELTVGRFRERYKERDREKSVARERQRNR
ncbi:hypothetical protein Scep_023514 [Stephania cephalantha]|uniref:Uncharacterized protein n=1 Tax=Stephania cephalantha TaxID=152367 RepID=A0AAP0EVB6_9MAGN